MYSPRVLLSAAALLPIFSAQLWAEDKTAAHLLPETVAIYAELSRPKHLMDVVLDHPLREQIEDLDEYKQLLKQKQYLEFRAVVSVLEAHIGQQWRPALELIAGKGVSVAIDTQTQGVAVLVNAKEPELLKKTFDALLDLMKEANGELKQGEYRGLTAYELNQAKVVAFDQWLLLTNKGDLGKAIIDKHMDGGESCLANSKQFQQAQKQVSGDPTVWAYLDVMKLRQSGAAEGLFQGRTDNPVLEVLLGGILSNLKKTSFATAMLHLDQQQVELELATPHKSSWTPESREYYFGPGGKGVAPRLLEVKDTLLTLSTYRNMSEMWLRAGDLFNEEVNDGFAQADSNLSTLFSGKDFGEEILGAVQPEMQLVVARQEFAKDQPQPAIKLPSFALVAQLREPKTMRRELKRTFQSLIGFLNVLGAMNGQPQADLDIEKEDDAQLVTATYASEVGEETAKDAPINFNFSPSVAFVDDLFIVSSTKGLARQLVAEAKKDQQAKLVTNTNARANLGVLKTVLADNRAQLVANNMLEEGNSKEEAEQQIGVLLAILDVFDTASLRLEPSENQLKLNLKVKLAEPKSK